MTTAAFASARFLFDSSRPLCVQKTWQIYNEEVKDLLNPTGKKLAIREDPKLGVFVAGLHKIVCKGDAGIAYQRRHRTHRGPASTHVS